MAALGTLSLNDRTLSLALSLLLLGQSVLDAVEVDLVLDHLLIKQAAGHDELAAKTGHVTSLRQSCKYGRMKARYMEIYFNSTWQQGSTAWTKINLW